MNLTDTQAAYFAGIIDGEGTIGVNYRAKRRYPAYDAVVRAKMYTTEPLTTMGGWLGKPATTFRLNDGQLITNWSATGVRARDVLLLIRPFLVLKASQADLLLRLLEIKHVVGPRRGGVGGVRGIYPAWALVAQEQIRQALKEAYAAHRTTERNAA